MKLPKQPNFKISGVIAKNNSFSGSKMNKVLGARISVHGLWLLVYTRVTSGQDDLIFQLV